MRKTITSLLAIVLTLSCVFSLAACGNTEKNITVVVREQGSGTREAFDKVVTDGEHFLEEKDANGKKVYNTTNTAVQQTKTGTVLSTVASDKNAIGYISLGSLNDSVKVVSVDGVVPSEATVLDGTYKIQRPFVVMTNANVTLNPITADFMNYLKSVDTKAHAEAAGCIFLEDGTKRANEGNAPIEVVAYTKQASLPTGGKIVVRGSTSMEKFINAAAKAYADLYGVGAEEIFDIQLGQYGLGYLAGDYDPDLYRVDTGLIKSEHPVQAYHDAQGNLHLVEMDIAKIEPFLTAEGNEYYAYMQIETAEPELIPVILEARRRIIYQDGAGWVEDHIDGCIRDSNGVVIEILPHFHEVFPSDWEIPWYPPEYNPKGSAYNP